MSIPQKKLLYPYTWGRSKIQQFVEKYPRGTKNLYTLCGIAPTEIRHKLVLVLCSGKSVKWEALKRCIKTLEDYEAGDIRRFSDEERLLLNKWIVYMSTDDVLDGKSQREALDTVRQKKLFL